MTASERQRRASLAMTLAINVAMLAFLMEWSLWQFFGAVVAFEVTFGGLILADRTLSAEESTGPTAVSGGESP